MAIIIIFKKIITNVDNDRENWNPHIADGNVKWYRHFKKINSLTSPQNVNPAIPFPKCIPKIIENTHPYKNLNVSGHSSIIIHHSQKL